jgi:DNA-binding NarL/FixJ family response regulator
VKYPFITVTNSGKNRTGKPAACYRWFSKEKDVRSDPVITSEVLRFIKDHGAKSVLLADRIIGFPPQAGVDYPEGFIRRSPTISGSDRISVLCLPSRYASSVSKIIRCSGEGLNIIIGSQPDMLLVAQAANALEAVEQFRRHKPDITLMDLRLPGTNGTDALIAIRGEFPTAKIIMLTTSDSDGEIQRALRAGASGYLLKSTPKGELLDAIRSVHAGQKQVTPEAAARLAEHLGEEDLTCRELEVLRLIQEGNRNKQIADRLGLRRRQSISTSRISSRSCMPTTGPMP